MGEPSHSKCLALGISLPTAIYCCFSSAKCPKCQCNSKSGLNELSYLQDDRTPDQVEACEQDVFVVALPVKQVVRYADQSHGHQGEGEILQEAKVQGQALAIVVPDFIWAQEEEQEDGWLIRRMDLHLTPNFWIVLLHHDEYIIIL